MAALPIHRITDLIDYGFLVRVDGVPKCVLIQEGLPFALERCVTAHEFRHAENRWATSEMPPLMRARVEEQCDRDGARSLIDPVHLRRWIDQAIRCGDPVDLCAVAADFDVSVRYAALSLAQLEPAPIGWADVPAEVRRRAGVTAL